MATNDSSMLRAPKRYFGIWPVVLCWILFAAMTIGVYLMDSGGSALNRGTLECVLLGVVFGQIALATILGGLIARSWVVSWFLAVLLACGHTVLASMACDHPPLVGPDALGRLALCFLWPVLLLSTCAPLVVLRSVWGWTLTRESPPAIPRWRSSFEDLLLVGVVIACSMTISQVFVVSEGPSTLPTLLMIMAVFAALSFVCMPLVVYVSFRANNWPKRLMGWGILSAIAFGGIFVAAAFIMEGKWQNSWDSLPYMAIGVPVGCLTVAVGITCLLFSGYRLTYFDRSASGTASAAQESAPAGVVESAERSAMKASPTTASAVAAPFEADWLDDTQSLARPAAFSFGPVWQARAITALLACIAAASVFSIQLARQQIVRFYEELDSHDLASMTLDEKRVVGIHFGPSFTDHDLEQFAKYAPTTKALSFAGTRVTDALIPKLKMFPELMELDLSDTAITDAGLDRLASLYPHSHDADAPNQLARLSLANTKITWPAVQELAERLSIVHLDLSGLGITDEQLETPIQARYLTLSRNPIGDQGVSNLLKNGLVHYLDLSDTAITGATLDSIYCPSTLILDGTKISDATLLAILRRGGVNMLSIARTAITSQVLPMLTGKSVRLGRGNITEEDLANQPMLNFNHLALNDKQFTGRCLLSGKIHSPSVDLSNSGVTDDVVASLGLSGHFFQYLGLAHTQVTDRCLQHRFSASQIDVRGTRVTASGISMTETFMQVIITQRQFPPKQMGILEHSRIILDSRPVERRSFSE